jgi:hypothetical protein
VTRERRLQVLLAGVEGEGADVQVAVPAIGAAAAVLEFFTTAD